tara:strand:+ start:2043 stop:2339 length:297 start_codon:yes stop_codon:yes gene_type:complete
MVSEEEVKAAHNIAKYFSSQASFITEVEVRALLTEADKTKEVVENKLVKELASIHSSAVLTTEYCKDIELLRYALRSIAERAEEAIKDNKNESIITKS